MTDKGIEMVYSTIITEVNVSVTVGMSITMGEMFTTVDKMSATVGEICATVEKSNMFYVEISMHTSA